LYLKEPINVGVSNLQESLLARAATFHCNKLTKWSFDENIIKQTPFSTHYGLDCLGIESRWGRDFPVPFQTDDKFHPVLYNEYRVFPGKSG